MMKKRVSRSLAAVLCLVMALSLFVPALAAEEPAQLAAAGSVTKQGGDMETAFIEWSVAAGVSKYEVFIKADGAPDSAYEKLDNELIRRYPNNTMRADALGLAAGSYVMKVVPNGNESAAFTSAPLTVINYDRSGYAFTNGHVPGAYTKEGTLKPNARVLYVTDANKNTVTLDVVDKDGKTQNPVGIQNILITHKKGKETRPLAVRFIGQVTLPSVNEQNGLLIKTEGTGYPANITLEGVGFDATLYGFGIRVYNAADIEVRNLGIMQSNTSDGDALSIESCWYVWFHDNDLFYGVNRGGDKAKGDGAMDCKGSKWLSESYNHFYDCGKCMLAGQSDSASDFEGLTIHHNWFDHSDSRHPRVRNNTKVHVYNNFYDGNAKYGVGATCASSIFVEKNYFLNCKNPMMISNQGTDAKGDGTFSGENGGMIKAYGNTFAGTSGPLMPYSQHPTDFDYYDAKTRDEKVPDSVKTVSGGTSYSNFDTASGFDALYEVPVMDADDNLVAHIQTYAGRLQGADFTWNFTDADNTKYDINTELETAMKGYKTRLIAIGGDISTSSDKTDNQDTPDAPEVQEPDIDPTVTVTSVTVTPATGTLDVGGTVDLTATVVATPDTAENKAVTWSSSNSAVATVDQNGTVTAKAAGRATITATSVKNTTKKATCVITVNGSGGGGTGGGDTPTGTTKKLDHAEYKMGNDLSADGKKSTLTQAELDENKNVLGYFKVISHETEVNGQKVVTTVHKRNANGIKNGITRDDIIGKPAEFLEIPKSNDAGIQFTVQNAPATVVVNWGTPKDTQKSTMVITDANGDLVANKAGETLNVSTKKAAADTTYELPAGTYMVHAPASTDEADHTVRLYTLTVTEAAGDTPPTPPTPTDFLDGPTQLHYTVSNGAVTVTDTIPAGDLVFASYWNGDKFLGAKTATKDKATTAVSGWTSIKLIWIDNVDAPQCITKTINK